MLGEVATRIRPRQRSERAFGFFRERIVCGFVRCESRADTIGVYVRVYYTQLSRKNHGLNAALLTGNGCGRWVIVKILPFGLLYTRYKDHRRLTVFVNKGLECVHPECTRKAELLVVAQESQHLGHPTKGLHVDLYTKDMHLMNVDHIIPKCQNGGEELENKQPMCEYHNSKKGGELVPY